MGLFLMIPRLLLSVLKSPVNDIRKYIISSIINIVIKNNNIQDIIKTTQPLIIIRTNLGIQITNLNIVMKVGILNFINAIIFFPFLFITKPLILVKMNFGIMVMPIAVIVAKLLRIIMKLVLKEHVLQLWKLIK